MSEESIRQLINAGSGVLMALAFLGAVVKMPAVLREFNAALEKIFAAVGEGAEHLEVANASLSEAAKIGLETTKIALAAKDATEAKYVQLEKRVTEVERDNEVKAGRIAELERLIEEKTKELNEVKSQLADVTRQRDDERKRRDDERRRHEEDEAALRKRIEELEGSLETLKSNLAAVAQKPDIKPAEDTGDASKAA